MQTIRNHFLKVTDKETREFLVMDMNGHLLWFKQGINTDASDKFVTIVFFHRIVLVKGLFLLEIWLVEAISHDLA